jgi:hypothetical protein
MCIAEKIGILSFVLFPLSPVLEQDYVILGTKLNNANIGRQVANSGLPSAPEQGGAKTRKMIKNGKNPFSVDSLQDGLPSFRSKMGLKQESEKLE